MILDKFYNDILFQISKGRVELDMMYNVLFETKINGKTLYKIDDKIKNDNSFFIPTLFINDKSSFDEALLKYYYKASDFYNNIDNNEQILTMLFNNATEEDFKNPINYINRYIDFLDNNIDLPEPTYISMLDSNIVIELKKEPIYQETPYALYIKSVKDSMYYNFPVVRFGISNNKAYIYAVQQIKDNNISEENLKYQKKIHRLLFKVNEGFIKEDEIDNINNPENITGISPSALVSLTIMLSIFENMNIEEVIIPTMLPVRYNAKEISYKVRINLLEKKGLDVENLNNIMHDLEQNHENIQRNLSDKFLRYFRRLEYCFSNIDISLLPYELDNNAHLKLKKYENCNNKLLDEIYKSTKNKTRNK